MNITFGFGFLVGSGVISNSSVSSAIAGTPANSAIAQLTLIHVALAKEIFMICPLALNSLIKVNN
jgi:hypothetical protein